MQPFPISPFAEVWASGGSPEEDRGGQRQNSTGRHYTSEHGSKCGYKMWFDSIQRMCVMLRALQDLSVGKMAVEGSIPCFVSCCLTLGRIIEAAPPRLLFPDPGIFTAMLSSCHIDDDLGAQGSSLSGGSHDICRDF